MKNLTLALFTLFSSMAYSQNNDTRVFTGEDMVRFVEVLEQLPSVEIKEINNVREIKVDGLFVAINGWAPTTQIVKAYISSEVENIEFLFNINPEIPDTVIDITKIYANGVPELGGFAYFYSDRLGDFNEDYGFFLDYVLHDLYKVRINQLAEYAQRSGVINVRCIEEQTDTSCEFYL